MYTVTALNDLRLDTDLMTSSDNIFANKQLHLSTFDTFSASVFT